MFFRCFLRAVGLILLLLSVCVTVLWMRSFRQEDVINVRMGGSVYSIFSSVGRISLWRWRSFEPVGVWISIPENENLYQEQQSYEWSLFSYTERVAVCEYSHIVFSVAACSGYCLIRRRPGERRSWKSKGAEGGRTL